MMMSLPTGFVPAGVAGVLVSLFRTEWMRTPLYASMVTLSRSMTAFTLLSRIASPETYSMYFSMFGLSSRPYHEALTLYAVFSSESRASSVMMALSFAQKTPFDSCVYVPATCIISAVRPPAMTEPPTFSASTSAKA